MQFINSVIFLLLGAVLASIILAFIGYGVGAFVIFVAKPALLFAGMTMQSAAIVFAWAFVLLGLYVIAAAIVKAVNVDEPK